MNKKIIAVCAGMLLCLTGCGAEEKSAPATGTIATDAIGTGGAAPTIETDVMSEINETVPLETESVSEPEATPEAPEVTVSAFCATFTSEDDPVSDSEYTLVPCVSVNVSPDVDLSHVTINNVEIDMSDITLAEALELTGLTHVPFGSAGITAEDFYFESDMFGIRYGETNDMSVDFEGTIVCIEVLDEQGALMENDTLDENSYDKYKVKAIDCDNFWTRDDFEIIYGNGIKSGMPKDDFISLMGEGEELSDYAAYNNGKNTLLVKYDTEDGVDVVDEVIIFNN